MNEDIEKNMGLVVSIVNCFHPKTNIEREEYIQAGRIGLWRALEKYNSSFGTALSTYAFNPIRWEIIKEIKRHKRYFDNHKDLPESMVIETNAQKISYDKIDHNYESIQDFFPVDLTAEERKVLLLRQRGLTFKEIRNEINKGSSYVKKLFVEAIDKIRIANEIDV